jgi:hypothetical protein
VAMVVAEERAGAALKGAAKVVATACRSCIRKASRVELVAAEGMVATGGMVAATQVGEESAVARAAQPVCKSTPAHHRVPVLPPVMPPVMPVARRHLSHLLLIQAVGLGPGCLAARRRSTACMTSLEVPCSRGMDAS